MCARHAVCSSRHTFLDIRRWPMCSRDSIKRMTVPTPLCMEWRGCYETEVKLRVIRRLAFRVSALRQSPGDGMCLNHLCYYAVWHTSHTARVTVAHACRQPYLLLRVESYSDISSMHCVIPVVVIYRATAYHLYWNSHTANASYQSYRPNPDFAPFKKIAGSL